MHDHIHEDAHEALHAAGIPHTHEHEDVHGHDHEYLHDHNIPHSHAHGHVHSHENTRAVLNRLSRAIGHLQSVKRMVEEGRDCSDVLIQLAAVRSAINNIGKLILSDHIEHCLTDAVEHGDLNALDNLNAAIDQFLK